MKRTFLLIAVIAMAGAFRLAEAADCGPGGSPTNGSGSCETSADQVRCGTGDAVLNGTLSVDPTGVEFCNDHDVIPVQGRVGVQQDCSCAYIDGDDDNNHDVLLNGWLRVDTNGVWCRERSKPGTQSYNSSQGQPLTECFT